MADRITIDISILQGIFGDLTKLQQQLSGVAGVAGTLDTTMATASGGIRQSLGGVTSAVSVVGNATDSAMRGMVDDIMGPVQKTRELEQRLHDLGAKMRTSRSVKEIVALKQEITATQRELDKVNTGGMEQKVSGGTSRMRGMFRSLIGPMAGVFAVSGISAFVGGLTKAAGAQQQFDASLKNMLQSKEKADALAAQVKSFAATTPFELPEVQDATKKMLAFGFGAEEAIPTLTRLGDVAAGLGQPVGDLAYLYGTTRVQGRLYTNDLMQFANRGIPIIEELSKVLGVSQAEVKGLVEKGKVGFPQLEEVFKNLTAEGSKFGGLMEAQSHTITGQLSNLSDAWGQFRSDLGESMAPLITGVIGGLSSSIGYLRDAFTWVQENGPLVKGVLTAIALGVGIYTAALLVNSSATFVNTVLQGGAAAALGLTALWTTLSTAAINVATVAQWAWNAALTANPIGVVIMAVAALVGAVLYAWHHFEGFRAFLYGLWEAVKSVFLGIKDIVTTVFSSLVDIVSGFGKTLVGAFTLDAAMIKEGIMQGAKGVQEALSVTDKIKDLGWKAGVAYAEGDAEGRASFQADQAADADAKSTAKGGAAKAPTGTTNALVAKPGDNMGAESLLGGSGAPGATDAGGKGSTVSGGGGSGDKNIAMNITMNMQFGIGRDVQQSARDTAEQVVGMITNKLRDAQFALG